LATLLVSQRNTSRYLLFNKENRLCGWRNHETGDIRHISPDIGFGANSQIEVNDRELSGPFFHQLGGGIKKATSLLCGNEPFLIHNVDILSNVDLKKLYDTQIEVNDRELSGPFFHQLQYLGREYVDSAKGVLVV